MNNCSRRVLCKRSSARSLFEGNAVAKVTTTATAVKLTKEVKPLKDIPGPRPSLPLFGTTWQYFKYVGRYELSKLHEAHMDKYRQYGPIVKEEYQLGKPLIYLYDPKDFETVFRHQGNYPVRPPNDFTVHYRSKLKDKYPNVGLAHLLGEEWLIQRRFIAPITTRTVVQKNFTAINQVCSSFANHLWASRNENTDIVEKVEEGTYRLALEAIAYFSLGTHLHCLSKESLTTDGSQLISATKDLFKAFHRLYYGARVWKFSPLFSPSYQLMAKAEETMYTMASKYIQKAFQEVEAGSGNPNTPIQILIRSKGLSLKEIQTTMVDFITGGTKTVSATLAFLFHNIASNQRVQEKLFDEIRARVGTLENLEVNHLSNMPYLKACVKESFRLSPTIPQLVRILPEDLVLSGYNVPAGTPVFTVFYVPSRFENYFERPDEFMPERWLRDNKKDLHPFCLLPFGVGARQCAGRWFSEMQIYLATINTVMQYKLEAVEAELDTVMSFMIEPKNNVQIRLFKRS